MTGLEQLAYAFWDAFTDWDWCYNEMMETHQAEEIEKEKAARLEELRRKADAFWVEWDKVSK